MAQKLVSQYSFATGHHQHRDDFMASIPGKSAYETEYVTSDEEDVQKKTAASTRKRPSSGQKPETSNKQRKSGGLPTPPKTQPKPTNAVKQVEQQGPRQVVAASTQKSQKLTENIPTRGQRDIAKKVITTL